MSLVEYIWLTAGVIVLGALLLFILAFIYDRIKLNIRKGVAYDHQIDSLQRQIEVLRLQLERNNVI